MSEFQQIFSGLMTGVLLILFLGICIWSWSSKRKDSFDRMAQLPLEDASPSSGITTSNCETRAEKDNREASL